MSPEEIRTRLAQQKLFVDNGVDINYAWSADFSCADLRGCTEFIGLNLDSVDFSGADLEGASFEGCDLSNTNFSYANLKGANMCNTYRLDTNFVGANLDGLLFS